MNLPLIASAKNRRIWLPAALVLALSLPAALLLSPSNDGASLFPSREFSTGEPAATPAYPPVPARAAAPAFDRLPAPASAIVSNREAVGLLPLPTPRRAAERVAALQLPERVVDAVAAKRTGPKAVVRASRAAGSPLSSGFRLADASPLEVRGRASFSTEAKGVPSPKISAPSRDRNSLRSWTPLGAARSALRWLSGWAWGPAAATASLPAATATMADPILALTDDPSHSLSGRMGLTVGAAAPADEKPAESATDPRLPEWNIPTAAVHAGTAPAAAGTARMLVFAEYLYRDVVLPGLVLIHAEADSQKLASTRALAALDLFIDGASGDAGAYANASAELSRPVDGGRALVELRSSSLNEALDCLAQLEPEPNVDVSRAAGCMEAVRAADTAAWGARAELDSIIESLETPEPIERLRLIKVAKFLPQARLHAALNQTLASARLELSSAPFFAAESALRVATSAAQDYAGLSDAVAAPGWRACASDLRMRISLNDAMLHLSLAAEAWRTASALGSVEQAERGTLEALAAFHALRQGADVEAQAEACREYAVGWTAPL